MKVLVEVKQVMYRPCQSCHDTEEGRHSVFSIAFLQTLTMPNLCSSLYQVAVSVAEQFACDVADNAQAVHKPYRVTFPVAGSLPVM